MPTTAITAEQIWMPECLPPGDQLRLPANAA